MPENLDIDALFETNEPKRNENELDIDALFEIEEEKPTQKEIIQTSRTPERINTLEDDLLLPDTVAIQDRIPTQEQAQAKDVDRSVYMGAFDEGYQRQKLEEYKRSEGNFLGKHTPRYYAGNRAGIETNKFTDLVESYDQVMQNTGLKDFLIDRVGTPARLFSAGANYLAQRGLDLLDVGNPKERQARIEEYKKAHDEAWEDYWEKSVGFNLNNQSTREKRIEGETFGALNEIAIERVKKDQFLQDMAMKKALNGEKLNSLEEFALSQNTAFIERSKNKFNQGQNLTELEELSLNNDPSLAEEFVSVFKELATNPDMASDFAVMMGHDTPLMMGAGLGAKKTLKTFVNLKNKARIVNNMKRFKKLKDLQVSGKVIDKAQIKKIDDLLAKEKQLLLNAMQKENKAFEFLKDVTGDAVGEGALDLARTSAVRDEITGQDVGRAMALELATEGAFAGAKLPFAMDKAKKPNVGISRKDKDLVSESLYRSSQDEKLKAQDQDLDITALEEDYKGLLRAQKQGNVKEIAEQIAEQRRGNRNFDDSKVKLGLEDEIRLSEEELKANYGDKLATDLMANAEMDSEGKYRLLQKGFYNPSDKTISLSGRADKGTFAEETTHHIQKRLEGKELDPTDPLVTEYRQFKNDLMAESQDKTKDGSQTDELIAKKFARDVILGGDEKARGMFSDVNETLDNVELPKQISDALGDIYKGKRGYPKEVITKYKTNVNIVEKVVEKVKEVIKFADKSPSTFDNARGRKIQPNVKGHYGNGGTAIETDKSKNDYRWTLVDADDIKSSFNPDDFNQPRDRNSKASEIQIDEISKNPIFEHLSLNSVSIKEGAPVTTNDGQILSGNGRVEGISRAYKNGNAENYRQGLLKNARMYGFTEDQVQGLKNPILIRVLDKRTPEQYRQLAIKSNQAQQQGMSDKEQARIDAERIKNIDDYDYYNDLEKGSNKPFIARFFEGLPNTEVAQYLDPQGNLTSSGYRRVGRTVLQMAFGDNKIANDLINNESTDLKNLSKALVSTAPIIAKSGNKKLSDQLLGASKNILESRKKNMDIEEVLSQQDIFIDESSRFEAELTRTLDKLVGKPNKIRDLMENLSTNWESKTEDSFLGDMGVNDERNSLDKLEQAKKDTGIDEAPQTNDDQPTMGLYQLAGTKSKTADLKKLDEAKRLESKKHSPYSIYQKTGWFKSLDNNWKYVINDFIVDENGNNALLNSEFKQAIKDIISPNNAKDHHKAKLKDLIDHPELFKAYPDLEDYNVDVFNAYYPHGETVNGLHDRSRKRIQLFKPAIINNNIDEITTTLMHEIQHAVQTMEGFSSGANSKNPDIKNYQQRFLNSKKYEYEQMKKDLPFDSNLDDELSRKYRALAKSYDVVKLIDMAHSDRPQPRHFWNLVHYAQLDNSGRGTIDPRPLMDKISKSGYQGFMPKQSGQKRWNWIKNASMIAKDMIIEKATQEERKIIKEYLSSDLDKIKKIKSEMGKVSRKQDKLTPIKQQLQSINRTLKTIDEDLNISTSKVDQFKTYQSNIGEIEARTTGDMAIGKGPKNQELNMQSRSELKTPIWAEPYSKADTNLNPDRQLYQLESFKPVDTNSKEFKKWFGNSKVVDEDGEPLKVYHGTTHDFNIFDSTRGNPENFLGRMNYFSDSEADSQGNYLSDGPDITNRIEKFKDQIVDDLEGFDSWDDVKQEYGFEDDNLKTLWEDQEFDELAEGIAKEKLIGGNERVIEAYLKIENPVYIDPRGDDTWIDNEVEIDESYLDDASEEIRDEYGFDEDEWEDEKENYEYEIRERAQENSGDMPPIQEAIQNVKYNYDLEQTSPEALFDYSDGISATKLMDILKEDYDIMESMDEDGNLNSGDIISDVFAELGYDGIILRNADKQFPNMNIKSGTNHYHIFDEPTKIKSAEKNTGEFSDTNPDIRYQLESTKTPEKQNSQFYMDRIRAKMRGNKHLEKAYDNFIDQYNPIRRFEQKLGVIDELSKKIDPRISAYGHEAVSHGIVSSKLDEIDKEVVKPIVDRLKRYNVSLENAGLYLYSKHAPERNKAMAEINPAKEDIQKALETGKMDHLENKPYFDDIKDELSRKMNSTESDKSRYLNNFRTQQEINNGLSGMSDTEAKEIQARYSNVAKRQMEDISKLIKTVNTRSLDLMLESGLISQEMYDNISKKYENYVPLQGFEIQEEGKSDPTKPMGLGSGLSIKGKDVRDATGRLSRAFNPLANSLANYENIVGRAERNLIAQKLGNNIKRFMDENPEQKDFKIWEPTYEPIKKGGVRKLRTNTMPPRDAFSYKENGEMQYIIINDERLRNSVLRLDNAQLGSFGRVMSRFNRFYGALLTSWNPEFIIPNLVRDLQTGFANTLSDEGIDKAVKMVKDNFIGSMKSLIKDDSGNPEFDKYRDEFFKHGGKTGYIASTTGEKVSETLSKKLDPKVPEVVSKSLETLGKYADAVENSTRLAYYITMRKNGKSPEESAYGAKNLTVNFNRKGNIGQVMNSIYLFSNATVQGNVRFAELMKTKRGQQILGGIAVAGFLYGVVQNALAPEDETGDNEYQTKSDFEKETNIHLFVPEFMGGSGEALKIPLAYGYNIPWNVGRNLADITMGTDKTAMKMAMNTAISSLGSFSPIQGTDPLNAIVPTMLKPFYEVATNQNFAGMPITKGKFGNDFTPESESGSNRATGVSKATAKALNYISGGDEYESGEIDLNPDNLDHFFNFLTGGTGKTLMKTANLPYELFLKDGEVEGRNLPLLSRFYSSDYENFAPSKSWKDQKKYEQILDKAEDPKNDKFRKENPELIREANEFKELQKQTRKIRKTKNQGNKDADKQIQGLWQDFYRRNKKE